MRRVPCTPRPNATRLVQSQGLVYTTDPPQPTNKDDNNVTDPYWPDNRYYSFTTTEISLLSQAATEVFTLCCEAADYLLTHPHLITTRLAIPAFALQQIASSWNREPAWGSVYGRFDVCFGGLDHPDERLRTPRFYEFNADTPTSLVEAASVQWLWLEQTGLGRDQWNEVAEKLIEGWRRNLREGGEGKKKKMTVHFAIARDEPTGEDAMNTLLLLDTCQQAGWPTKAIFMDEIARSEEDGRFYDLDGDHIDVIFKLYPWEFMMEEEFARDCFLDMAREDGTGTVWIEPPYKMLWSNKGLFAILWELFKDDPRGKWLLPTYFEDDETKNKLAGGLTRYARKPIFAREGADVTLHADGKILQDSTTGLYGKEGYIIQELALLPEFLDPRTNTPHYPVLGLWMVDGEVAGLGIREDKTPITTNGSNFIPHSIEDGEVNYERKEVPSKEEIEAVLTVERCVNVTKREGEVLSYIGRLTRGV
ncbi:glutathionylspermidine synthase [Dichotomopilus funicola]|uniref:Glutathionylspermidine synthase n=1 Tax=Dichotomopilus funicola TaxID=1934379 RepID=A0AAN6V9V5_9PEZI|nr:glutathionylspermidine synthase [Dichotomopilus funicola]